MDKIYNSATFKKVSLFLLVAFIGASFAFMAAGEYKLIMSIPTKVKFMTTDPFKNLYVINGKNQVVRYDSTGRVNGSFSDDRYGELTAIDATSPFNILMFFKDYATIVSVDNSLSSKSLFKLPSLDINNVGAMCLSYDNYIWFYDLDDSKLKKIDKKYQIIYESQDMQSLTGLDINPNFLIERDDFIYMNDPELGIITFDMFGNYMNSFPITGLQSFQVVDKKIVFFDGEALRIFNLESYNARTQAVQTVPLPEAENIDLVQVEPGHLFLYKNGELQLFNRF